MQELQANLKLVDVIHTSDAGHFVLLKEKKLLMKYTPAGVDAFPAGFKDKDGYYYGLRATVNVIAYNISRQREPRHVGQPGVARDPEHRVALHRIDPSRSGGVVDTVRRRSRGESSIATTSWRRTASSPEK